LMVSPQPSVSWPDYGDPALPLIAAIQEVVGDIQQLREQAKQEAVATTAKNLAAELPGAIDRLVVQRDRRLLYATAAVVLLTAFVSFGAGAAIVFFSVGPLKCENRPDGARICYRWENLPSKPPRP
jgi:hypothetical protein